jgi:hypothetical protein
MTRARLRATEREPMRRMPWALMLCVLVLGAALASCDGPNRGGGTQPSAVSGLIMDLVASPNTLRPGGCGIIQAKVSDTKGNLVDGVQVTFATSPGRVALGTTTAATTTRGIATVTFCAGTGVGTDIVTAAAEDAFDTVLITIF